MTQGQFFKRSLTGLNSEFSFSYTSCLTKAEEPSLPFYLPIAGGGIIGFPHFPRVLVLCEMQSVSSMIWTRVAVSISYDENHYNTGTSICIFRYFSFGMEVTVVLWLSSKKMDTARRVRFLDETDWISHSTNTFWKVKNSLILSSTMGKR